MKSRIQHIALAFLLSAVALSVTACPPPFFCGTSFSDPVTTDTTILAPKGKALAQKVMFPGTLAQAAVNPDDTMYFYINLDISGPSSRRLEIWDGDSAMFRTIDSNPTRAAVLLKRYIQVRPAVDLSTVTVSWHDTDTSMPYISVDGLLDSNTAGTIFEIGVLHELNGQHLFKSDVYYMMQDRFAYVRKGAGETTSPEITMTTASEGDTLTGDLLLYVDKPLGNLQSFVVDQGDSVTAKEDNVYYPLIVVGMEQTAGNTVEYKLGTAVDDSLPVGVDLKLVIMKEHDGDSSFLPYSDPYMVFSQDMSGNVLTDPYSIFTVGELADILGGSTTHIQAYSMTFRVP